MAREAIPYLDVDYKTNLFSVNVPSKGVLNLSASSPTLPMLAILFDESYRIAGLGMSSSGGALEMGSPVASGKYSLALFAPAGRLGSYVAKLGFNGADGSSVQNSR